MQCLGASFRDKLPACSPICHHSILPILWDRLSANADAYSSELDTHATAEATRKLEVVDGHCEGCVRSPGQIHAVSLAWTVTTSPILVSILAIVCGLQN